MRDERQPVYMIGVAAQLCRVHPQTLRQYEKLGLVVPARVGSKNRLYSEFDIAQVQRIQRLTQQLGVNLAGVEIILKLLEDIDDLRRDMESQFEEYRQEAERRIHDLASQSNLPVRRGEEFLPSPRLQWRKPEL